MALWKNGLGYWKQLLRGLGKNEKLESQGHPVPVEHYLADLEGRFRYFQHHAQVNPLFIPEMDTAALINIILINKGDKLTREDVLDILRMLNKVIDVEHYDGVGWMIYQQTLKSYLLSMKMHVEWENGKPWKLV